MTTTKPLRTCDSSGEFARYDAPNGVASEVERNQDLKNAWMQVGCLEVGANWIQNHVTVTYNSENE